MKDERRPARNAVAETTAANRTIGHGERPAPALHIWLEQPGQLILAADTYEDELRLRAWLRRTRALAALPDVLKRLLDDLDERRAA